MRQIPVDFIVPIVFIDLACFALVLGATVWFFFVQSPQLMKFLGMFYISPVSLVFFLPIDAVCVYKLNIYNHNFVPAGVSAACCR